MGQRNWAGACALASVLWSSSLAAQEIRPDTYVAGPQRTEAARRIEGALREPLRSPLEFAETPLNSITQIIVDEYDIPIVFDIAAFDAVAMTPDVEVTVNLRNITLRSALELMLDQLEDLTFVVDDEVLLITTEDEANSRLEVRVYRVDDLWELAKPAEPTGEIVIAGGGGHSPLVRIIINCIEHDSWMDNGTGEGQIGLLAPGMLVVAQPQRIHAEIDMLLAELRAVKREITKDARSPEASHAHAAEEETIEHDH